MSEIKLSKEEGIATLTLARGKVNAINESFAEALIQCFKDLKEDPSVRSVVLTGSGPFFSFGLDVPELYHYSKEDFPRFLKKFTTLCTDIFIFPKPVIAAVNGHAIAGGCMLATACDYRVMASGKAKISLNEVTFGATVFAGSVAVLKFCVGSKNAQEILYSGAMYSAEEALQMGLIDKISEPEKLAEEARDMARHYAGKHQPAFSDLKRLLREPVAEAMVRREEKSIREFVDIWYTEKTREMLKDIKIH